jgi:hypothetical protein
MASDLGARLHTGCFRDLRATIFSLIKSRSTETEKAN